MEAEVIVVLLLLYWYFPPHTVEAQQQAHVNDHNPGRREVQGKHASQVPRLLYDFFVLLYLLLIDKLCSAA